MELHLNEVQCWVRKIIGLYASSKCDRQPENNHCFLFSGNNINNRQAKHLVWSLEGETVLSGGEYAGAFCISSDILQSRTDVKLATGNWAGWKQNRKGASDSRVRVAPQKHCCASDNKATSCKCTHTHSHTDKPFTPAAGFLMFIEKNGNIAVPCWINFVLYKNIGLMALIQCLK